MHQLSRVQNLLTFIPITKIETYNRLFMNVEVPTNIFLGGWPGGVLTASLR